MKKIGKMLSILICTAMSVTVFTIVMAMPVSADTEVIDFSTFETVIESSGSWWDSQGIGGPFVMKENGIYKMWHTAHQPGNQVHIGYAESTDGFTWTNRQMVHSEGGWPRQTSRPFVMKEDNTYIMYHTDYYVVRLGNWEHYLSRLTSNDGIYWGNEQTMLTGTNSYSDWDGAGLASTAVIKEGAQYTMWYSGWTRPNPFSIGRATSTDGITWTGRQEVMSPSTSGWDSGGLIPGDVVKESDGTYTMYLWVHPLDPSITTSIGRAKSTDGITWTDRELILTPDDIDVSSIGLFDIDYFRDTDGKEYLYFSFSEEVGQILKIGRVQFKSRDLEVAIDIKPGSCPNPLNVKSKGVLPVAILGSEDFDVNAIDVASIRLEDVAPIRSSLEDTATPVSDGNECECTTEGPDGYLDLTLKFETEEIVNTLGEVNDCDVLVLTLTGLLQDGKPIKGADCVLVLGKFKPLNKADIDKDGIVDFADFTLIAENWLQSSIVQD